jgi:hypothetical protein
MSWFKRVPHRREETRRTPHHPSPAAEELRQEIELNRRRLEEHRTEIKKEQEYGKLH